MGGGLHLAGTAAVSTAAAAAASVAAASLLLLPLLLPLLLAAMSFPSPNAHLNQARSPTCGAAWRPGRPRHVHPILPERRQPPARLAAGASDRGFGGVGVM